MLAQTQQDFRLIVSDDCGPDSAAAEALVRSYRDQRISYHRTPRNLGLAGNWNHCLDLAGSGLVTLLHADDRLKPGYVGLMREAHRQDPQAALYFCNAGIIGPDGRPVFSFPDFYKRLSQPRGSQVMKVAGDHGLAALLQRPFIMCPSICYNMERIGSARFSPQWRMVLDLEFYSRLLFRGEHFHGIGDIAYEYRRHGTNQTVLLTKELTRFREELSLYDAIGAEAGNRGFARTVGFARKKTIIKLNLLYCLVQDLLRLRLAAAWRKSTLLLRPE